MRSGYTWVCAIALAGVPALAESAARAIGPVGLVMSAGATLGRGGQFTSAKPGEVLYSGDSLRTANAAVTFLFCPSKQSATLAPSSEAVLGPDGFQVTSGKLQQHREVSACFLPPVQKLSVASMQHYGSLIARAGNATPPNSTLEQRIANLPAPVRDRLNAELAPCDAAIAGDPGDVAALVGRAAALERAGLLFDAAEAYRRLADRLPALAWAKAKVGEMDRRLEEEQLKKE